MLNIRKRKVADYEELCTSDNKKLRDDKQLFREDVETRPVSEAKNKINKLLPEGYSSIIVTASTKINEDANGYESIFGSIRLPIISKADAFMWIKKFELKTFTSYFVQKTWKKDTASGLFKCKLVCNYRDPTATSDCKACLIFTIKDPKEIETNPDYYLRDYPSQVIIQFCHNHKIDSESFVKHLRPSNELRQTFSSYYKRGHSPFSALICHKCDLHSLYGPEFYNVVSSNYICPPYNWCSREYEKEFHRKFAESSEETLLKDLQGCVKAYNENFCSEYSVLGENSLVICSPLMKRVFESGFAEDLITVRCFTASKLTPKAQKLFLFLSHTPIGSLPFGIVLVNSAEPAPSEVNSGITALLNMLGMPNYSPKNIIIDENTCLSGSLNLAFPESQIIFNEFQMLQSIWRVIRLVCEDDHEEFQTLYDLFLVILNSASEADFNCNFDNLQIYAEKYPKLGNFLKYFKLRASRYVLYSRPKVEFNIDVLNYTDSGTIILQDIAVKYSNRFNIVQLFDFLTKSYVIHYERKLNKIVEGDLKGFYKTNFYVPLSKIAEFACEKISDTEFLVSLDGTKFFVNAELDTCTCQAGVHGGSCVHQYIVEKNLGLVPECYTPLGEDMLGIFKSILSYKDERKNDNASLIDELLNVQAGTSSLQDFSLDDDIFDMADLNEGETNVDEVEEDEAQYLNDTSQYDKCSGELEPMEEVSDYVEPSTAHSGKENDEKTAEIAEFLTNLPDTCNSKTQQQEVVSESLDVAAEEGHLSNQEDLLKDDGYFAEYDVMENGVLSMVEGEDQSYKGFSETAAPNLMDSYEDSMVMMPPEDIFGESVNDTKSSPAETKPSPTESKPPPAKTKPPPAATKPSPSESKVNILSSVVIQPSNSPLSLDLLKKKTLRVVKEPVKIIRIKNGSQKLQIKVNNERGKQRKGDDSQSSVASRGAYNYPDRKATVAISGQADKKPIDVIKDQPLAASTSGSTAPATTESKDVSCADKHTSDVMDFLASTFNSEQLEVENNVSVAEIDSDDLEELASKDIGSLNALVKGDNETADGLEELASQDIGSLNALVKGDADAAKAATESVKTADPNGTNPDVLKDQDLIGRISTAFSQLTELAATNKFKDPIDKFLTRFKELASSNRLVTALENFGADLQPQTQIDRRRQSTDSDVSVYGDSEDSVAWEHYNDCRSSCSDFHSELEELDDDDYDQYIRTIRSTASVEEPAVRLPPGIRVTRIAGSSSKGESVDKRLELVRGVKLPSRYFDDDSSSSESDKESDDDLPPFKVRRSANESSSKTPAYLPRNKTAKVPADLPDIKPPIIKLPITTINSRVNKQKTSPVKPIRKNSKSETATLTKSYPTVIQPRANSRLKTETTTLGELITANKRNKGKFLTKKKEVTELERILTGADDLDVNKKDKKTEKSILKDADLSFLFNDPRFEAIVLEGEEPSEDLDTPNTLLTENVADETRSETRKTSGSLDDAAQKIVTLLEFQDELNEESKTPAQEKKARRRPDKKIKLKEALVHKDKPAESSKPAKEKKSSRDELSSDWNKKEKPGLILSAKMKPTPQPKAKPVSKNKDDEESSKISENKTHEEKLPHRDTETLKKHSEMSKEQTSMESQPVQITGKGLSDSGDSEILNSGHLKKPKRDRSKKKSTAKLELIVLLERNIDIEILCQKKLTKSPYRTVDKSRRGYKELLESAIRMKNL